MADRDAAYAATLTGQLQATYPDLLARAENDLALLRARIALVARWINNPVHDAEARRSLAQALGLPEPAPEKR